MIRQLSDAKKNPGQMTARSFLLKRRNNFYYVPMEILFLPVQYMQTELLPLQFETYFSDENNYLI